MTYKNTLNVVVNVNMFSLVVNGREEKISAAKKEPLQIMQEVIHIAAATPSSECVPVFRVCIVLYKSLFGPVYYTVLTMTSFFFFFRPENSLKDGDTLNEDQKHTSTIL